MFKLRRPGPIHRRARPVVRPRLVAVAAQADHGLDGEAHARLGDANGLVLGVVGHAGGGVEELVDAVAAVGADDGAGAGLGVLLDGVARVADRHARFDEVDGLGEAFAGGFDDADGVAVGEGAGADVVGFVEVAVEAVVVEGDVEVEDVAVEEDAVVGDAVANYFVGGGAEGFGEVDVV